MGTPIGALKTAAERLGMSLVAYLTRLDGGELWCWKCRAWHAAAEFGVDRRRPSGRAGRCRASRAPAGGRDGRA